jgi:hypothetical protein
MKDSDEPWLKNGWLMQMIPHVSNVQSALNLFTW